MTYHDIWSIFGSDPVAKFAFASLGAFSLWLRLKYGTNLAAAFDRLVNEILVDFEFRMLAALLLFVIFGSIFAIMIVDPATGRQAFAAGATCTVLLGNLEPPKARQEADG